MQSFFDDKHWKGSQNANQASVIESVTDKVPPSYITDGNTASFEKQAIEFIEVLKDKGVETSSLFYDPSEVK